jgi:hypothetical protein
MNLHLSILTSILNTNELTSWLEEWLESIMHWHISTIDDKHVVKWAIELNRARNAAVHEGELPKYDTLDKGIFAVEAIHDFVKEGL